MSSYKTSAYGDYEYLRAAILQKEHTENEHRVVVNTTIGLRRSPCVLVVSLEAREASSPLADEKIAGDQVEWPNATTVGWTATLFQAYVKLDQMVEEYRTNAEFLLAHTVL